MTPPHLPSLPPPRNYTELVGSFGNPLDFLRPDGTLAPTWERRQIVRVDLPAPLRLDFRAGDDEPTVTRITAHRWASGAVESALKDLHDAGLWSGLVGYSGGFVFRPQRNSKRLSLHAWGLAWDFGASRDPLGDKPGIEDRPGDEDMPMDIVAIMEEHGFTWGGRWNRADQMHFQWAHESLP